LIHGCTPIRLLPIADAISAGNARIELAKITGITPDWFTFNGM